MSRFFVHLAYRGSKYRGWQWQPDVPSTVQGFLEDTFLKIFKEEVRLHGCGRTDAEVHASQYFLHFDMLGKDEFILNTLKERLNFMLPYDIAIYDVIKVEPNANARFDASSRKYIFHLHYKKNPFLRFSSSHYPNYYYDLEQMQEVVSYYATQTDFRSMCKRPDQYKHTKCRIDEISLRYDEAKDDLVFEITANRFLQGMIRQLVGRMLDVGRGNLAFEDLKKCFETGKQPKITIPAYPQGLYLCKVEYPFLKIEPKPIFPF